MLLPHLGLSQHFMLDMLGPNTGISSVFPQWDTASYQVGRMEERRLTDWERRAVSKEQ